MTSCLLLVCLLGQRLDVNLGAGWGKTSSCSIRVAEGLKGLNILVRQSVGADGAEWSRRAGAGCKEL